MQLLIHDNLQLADVQDRFSDCFPGLKIEFFEDSRSKRLPASDDIISSDTYIGEIRKQHYSGIFEIKSWNTVDKIEKGFQDMFGLNVQIFHRDNSTWVLTNNNRTLRDQVIILQKIKASKSKAEQSAEEFEW